LQLYLKHPEANSTWYFTFIESMDFMKKHQDKNWVTENWKKLLRAMLHDRRVRASPKTMQRLQKLDPDIYAEVLIAIAISIFQHKFKRRIYHPQHGFIERSAKAWNVEAKSIAKNENMICIQKKYKI
jgi:hypothetical protein